jgi:serine/threonine protein kinase
MFRQEGTLSPWSDFYSLGCVAYELACGSPPFVSDNHFQLAGLHDREAIEPPSIHGSRLGSAGDPFILRLLAKLPSDRFAILEAAIQGLDDLHDALRAKARPEARSAPILGEASLIRYATDARMSVVSFMTDPRSVEDTLPMGIELGAKPLSTDEPLISADLLTGFGPDWSRSSIDTGRALPQIGRYVIIRELGQGGLGTVYLARDEALGREVAIKLHDWGFRAGPEVLARLRIEAMTVARLSHPNIVSIYDVGETDEFFYVVLEYVDGGDLRRQMGDAPWPPDEAARLMITLARAVAYAHSVGIIHRDLKPSNILLTKERMPKISDFGLAKLIGQQQHEAADTAPGMVLGTPSYMAPEQASGEINKIGPPTDVHALGAMLYELLAGRRPFQGGTPFEMLMQVREYRPEAPSRWRPELPRDLDAICLKCLAKEPGGRYPTAVALADDLERFLDGNPVLARPPTIWDRARRLLPFKRSSAATGRPGR